MILKFRHKGLEDFWWHGDTSGISTKDARKIRRILTELNAAKHPAAMSRQGLRLHRLEGPLEGHFSVRVNANWRITFRFEGRNATDVNFQDYH